MGEMRWCIIDGPRRTTRRLSWVAADPGRGCGDRWLDSCMIWRARAKLKGQFMAKSDDNRDTGPHEAPGTYPVLPLRDIVVFPHMVVPLFVGREKSIRALEEVMRA